MISPLPTISGSKEKANFYQMVWRQFRLCAVEVMAQVWGCAKPTKGSLTKAIVLKIMARNQEMTLPWAAPDTGITKTNFGVYSVADSCATAVQPLNHVNNGH